MTIDQVEVYITPDGLGRAAIVRRDDGNYCIYLHWKLAESVKKSISLVDSGSANWLNDVTSFSLLYENAHPEPGLYGTLDDARRQLKSLPRFSEARIWSPD
jgi:hypothetical protein